MKKIPRERQEELSTERNLALEYADELKALEIKSEDEKKVIERHMNAAHKKIDFLEKERKKILDPVQKTRKAINDFFLPVVKAYAAIKDEADACLARYVERLEKENEEVLEQVKDGDFEAAQKLQPIVVQSNDVRYGDTWTADEVDFSKIPRKFLSVDWPAVRKHLKQHQDRVPIPGMVIRKKIDVRIK